MPRVGQVDSQEQWDVNVPLGGEEKMWIDKFTNPETVGCETADGLLETDDKLLIDSLDYIVKSKNNFFTHLEGNECRGCCGIDLQRQYRAKCTCCEKNPVSDVLN